jgi:hypothetical protein
MGRIRLALFIFMAASPFAAVSARADMCGGGGGHDPSDAPTPDAATPDSGARDAGSVGFFGRRARQVGAALILVAGLGGSWLAFRPRGKH